jgi:hypothetical protein
MHYLIKFLRTKRKKDKSLRGNNSQALNLIGLMADWHVLDLDR